MHITDLHIDRFGVWRDLTLPFPGSGLSVLYGPNEAGKSTLKRFVTAILYGGEPPRAEADADASSRGRIIASGSLTLTHAGASYVVKRQLDSSGTRRLEILGPDEKLVPEDRLTELLHATSESVFERVFAIDLFELQELATLDHEELAGHVYGLSLGTRGKRLLAAADDLKRQRDLILSSDGRTGRLARLLEQEHALLTELRSLPDVPALQSEISVRREKLEGEIESLKRRRSDLQLEIRGRKFLERVHPTWRQVQTYTADLEKLPERLDLPAEGLAQLDAIEKDLETAGREQERHRRDAGEAKRKIDAIGSLPKIVRAEPAVRAMLGLREWIKETTTARDAAANALQKANESSQKARAALGGDWTDARLTAVDTSPQAQLALLDAARAYRVAVGRRSDLRRKYRRLQNSANKREARIQERIELLGKHPEAAAAELRQRLSSIEQMTELRAREAALDLRGQALRQRLDQFADSLEIPGWVSAVLAIFAIGGAIFAVMGMVAGVTWNAIGGIAYLLLGVTCGTIAFKLRHHFETALQETAERVRDERRAEDVELRKTREEIARLSGATGPAPAVDGGTNIISLSAARRIERTSSESTTTESLRDAIREFADLDDLVTSQEKLRRARKMLTTMRARLRKVQQTVEAARQEWCQTLIRVGLPETLDVEGSLATWQQLAHAASSRAVAGPAAREHAVLDTTLRKFNSQLVAIGQKFELTGDADRPLELLAKWEHALEAALKQATARVQQVEFYRRSKSQAKQLHRSIKELRQQRRMLLTDAGVRSRAEYARRLKAAEERLELEELLALAQSELESLAAAEPELAIFEEDLVAFRSEENAEVLRKLSMEQDTLEAKLESSLERRGNLTQQLDDLAADDRATVLRRKHARLERVMERMTQRLVAVSLAERAAEQARSAYERDRQPAVLTAASEVLARLTRNRYVRIWAPLGERALRVDDDHGRTFAVEQLSGGTREQLFLALRLGLVRHAAERGVELPLILDDVFVNFDQLRTEAAFEALRDFANEGRQVLFFTCHLHLAHLAESRGIAPIWLPGHNPPMQQRLAG